MLQVITVSSELISLKLDCWAATCKQSKNETRLQSLEQPTLQLAILKYRYENDLDIKCHLDLRSYLLLLPGQSEKALNMPVFTDKYFFWLHISFFNLFRQFFLGFFCKYFIVG